MNKETILCLCNEIRSILVYVDSFANLLENLYQKEIKKEEIKEPKFKVGNKVDFDGWRVEIVFGPYRCPRDPKDKFRWGIKFPDEALRFDVKTEELNKDKTSLAQIDPPKEEDKELIKLKNTKFKPGEKEKDLIKISTSKSSKKKGK